MANVLGKCYVCGHQVSTGAVECANCKDPDPLSRKANNDKFKMIFVVVVLLSFYS